MQSRQELRAYCPIFCTVVPPGQKSLAEHMHWYSKIGKKFPTKEMASRHLFSFSFIYILFTTSRAFFFSKMTFNMKPNYIMNNQMTIACCLTLLPSIFDSIMIIYYVNLNSKQMELSSWLIFSLKIKTKIPIKSWWNDSIKKFM